MATEIHFVRRDQDLVVEDAVDVVAEMAAKGTPIRLTRTDGAIIYVNWTNVPYAEALPLGVAAAGEPRNS